METMKITLLLSLTIVTSLITGCSDNEDNSKKATTEPDHIWKQQTDTLKTSKDAANKLQESLNRQQQQIDERD